MIAASFVLAGFVKGVVGLGLPSVSLALLTALIGLQPAIALMLIPSFVTNLWQAAAGPDARGLVRRLFWMLVMVAAGIALGVAVLARVDPGPLSVLLGATLILYGAGGLARPALPAPGRRERWLSPLIGAVNGVMTGLTGSLVMPGVAYLQALGLGRDELHQAMGILFTWSTLVLAVGLGGQRMLSPAEAALSAAAVLPAILGMAVGARLRARLSDAAFRKALFAALMGLGLFIVWRNLA